MGSAEFLVQPKRNSFIGQDGRVKDEYIAQRAVINKAGRNSDKLLFDTDGSEDAATAAAKMTIADLTKDIVRVDGRVLAQLLLSGYARLNSKVDELNRINVFPIADGDTGANMKACLKIPARNLLLDRFESSIATVSSNAAADVLLNGQGNSGTILSHFYVSLAEEIREFGGGTGGEKPDSLSIDEFASCLRKAGRKMADAVPSPVEGTLLSVSRDSCANLPARSFSTLRDLLEAWNDLAREEVLKTPDKLIVDGVKVLEKAGVVDSGAQGFAYCVEGMVSSAQGENPEAVDLNLFKTGVVDSHGVGEILPAIDDDHTCDSKYRFCTEAVVSLKDNVSKQQVMEAIQGNGEEIGDSIACVSGPAKDGGKMAKVHIHTDSPQQFFDKLLPFSRDPVLLKEKVEDMKVMRELEHGEKTSDCLLSEAKFTIVDMGGSALPPLERSNELFTIPMFIVPANTEEPIDVRYATDTEALLALNAQRRESTAIRYTTAAPSPMQIKVELLAALGKGKPVLLFLFSKSSKFSSYGRNICKAIDMLDPEQRKSVKMLVHGWTDETSFVMEAIRCAKEGKTIDEAYAACEDYASRTFGCISFMSHKQFVAIKTWRPNIFPEEFDVEEGSLFISGTPAAVRSNAPSLEERFSLGSTPIGVGDSLVDSFEKAARHIKDGLKPGQKIGNLMIPCVGRPDNGHLLVKKLEDAGIEIVGTPDVFSYGIVAAVMMEWGLVRMNYKIIEE